MTQETPQPRCDASSADRMTFTLPVQSNVKSTPQVVSSTRRCWIGVSESDGLKKSVAPNSAAIIVFS